MVLLRRATVLGLFLFGGCSESLFGAHRGDSNGSPPTCTGACIADAALDFDGTPGGQGRHWRYLEDTRDRMWKPMTGDIMGMIGIDQGNRITTCAAHPEAPACKTLPGALLVSAAGTSSAADPAIEFTANNAQVIKLSLHVFVPSGDDQTIRLYRNSREDVLFTGTAVAGTRLDQAITLDALPSDRFLVAIVPPGSNGATDVALDLSADVESTNFPSTCQLALRCDSITGDSTVDTVCSNSAFIHLGGSGTPVTLTLGAAAFKEQGNSIRIPSGTYLHDPASTDKLDYSHDVTVQLWANQAPSTSASTAWLFSNLDAAKGDGIGISILPGAPAMLDVKTGTTPAPSFVHASAMYPSPNSWHFIRVVHTSTEVRVCVDGDLVTMATATAPNLATTPAPDLGKDIPDPSAAASFDGFLDDVRVITGALPCK